MPIVLARRRIFTALLLDGDAIKAIERQFGEFFDVAPKIIKEEARLVPILNWHITLIFLGDQNERSITRVAAVMREVVPLFSSFPLRFRNFTLAPPGLTARMLWATTDKETSRRIGAIADACERGFRGAGVVFRGVERPFVGHVTLARFDPVHGVRVKEQLLPIRSTAKEFALMESELLRSGAEYKVLQKFALKNR